MVERIKHSPPSNALNSSLGRLVYRGSEAQHSGLVRLIPLGAAVISVSTIRVGLSLLTTI